MGIVGRQVTADKLGVVKDDGQEVVEVVGNATRKSADRFHFAGLLQLLLQHRVLGDVPADTERAPEAARRLLGSAVVGAGGVDLEELRGAVTSLELNHLAAGGSLAGATLLERPVGRGARLVCR